MSARRGRRRGEFQPNSDPLPSRRSIPSPPMEDWGYAFAPFVLPAAGFGAPHPRHRIFFVADAVRGPAGEHPRELQSDEGEHDVGAASRDHRTRRGRTAGGVADAAESRPERARQHDGGPSPLSARSAERGSSRPLANTADADRRRGERRAEEGIRPDGERRRGPAGNCALDFLGDSNGQRYEGPAARTGTFGRRGSLGAGAARKLGYAEERRLGVRRSSSRVPRRPSQSDEVGPCNGFWADAEWLACVDRKARPVEPGTFPLASGIANRVGRLRAYGNSIVAPQAAEFIRAYLELRP
jgi:DNA (cytosine-5)-methyltransferase 1